MFLYVEGKAKSLSYNRVQIVPVVPQCCGRGLGYSAYSVKVSRLVYLPLLPLVAALSLYSALSSCSRLPMMFWPRYVALSSCLLSREQPAPQKVSAVHSTNMSLPVESSSFSRVLVELFF